MHKLIYMGMKEKTSASGAYAKRKLLPQLSDKSMFDNLQYLT